ncbi:MAG: hypothetical protein LBE51_13575 [Acidovorax sp.]|jgi:hypothetical protein|nr:hypothetical protein [Acidovorax sp.]
MSKTHNEIIAEEVVRRVFSEVFAPVEKGPSEVPASTFGAYGSNYRSRTDAEIQDCAERAIKISQQALAAP